MLSAGREHAADVVEAALEESPWCSALNSSETAQKVSARYGEWDLARGLLLSYGLIVEPLLVEDAERAATAWTRGGGLSFADRLCLATGERIGATVWTADTAWGHVGRCSPGPLSAGARPR